MPEADKADVIQSMLARERFEREGGGSVQTPMPKYRCHKEVWALKIADVIKYVRKHDPKPGGYYVVYEDGYTSWSPADAFEGGYTRIQA